MDNNYVLIRGGGDLASGVAVVLQQAGYHIIMLEIAAPTCVRRMVSFANAVYEKMAVIEGVTGKLATNFDEAIRISSERDIAVLVDETGETIGKYKPLIFIDGAMAKKNLGTRLDDAELVIALGPGFEAGKDAHVVIETHGEGELGRIIYSGTATADTGIPRAIRGYASERLIKAPDAGVFWGRKEIGETIKAGDIIAQINETPVIAQISGVLRGLLHDGLHVKKGLKIGDIDPRNQKEYCFTISDKARAVAGGVMEAMIKFAEGA